MKQQLFVAAGTCILTLLITLALNALSNRLLEEKGRVTIGKPIATSGEIVAEVRIENWNSKPIDGLILAIPSSVSTSTLVASFPINIEDVQGYTGSKDSKRIKISGIPPGFGVRILIPVSSIKSTEDFALPNISQYNLEAQWNDYAENPTHQVWFSVIAASITYALLAGLIAYFGRGAFDAIMNKDRKEREELKAKIGELQTGFEKSKGEATKAHNEMKQIWMKYSLYLLSRISDYSKELEFWRDTVRKILLSGGVGKERAEEVLTSVMVSLHTYGTQGRADATVHFDSILEVARLLTKPESAEQG
ncbi:MAG: hypothetical protein WAL75_18225 [Terracidiphilus sp.]